MVSSDKDMQIYWLYLVNYTGISTPHFLNVLARMQTEMKLG